MNVVDFAYEVIEMQQRIEMLERQLAHYKDMYEMQCDSLARSDTHTRKMTAMILEAALDPDSAISKGNAVVAVGPTR